MTLRMRACALAVLSTLLFGTLDGLAQSSSPSDTVLAFYRLLRAEQYREGFALSVYGGALEGLSAEDFAELTPEFQRTFSNIPETIVIEGEQVSGTAATVFARFGGDQIEQVSLVKTGGRWIVGDWETLDQVNRDRGAFFFNARIDVNQTETLKLVREIVEMQEIAMRRNKGYATLEQLIESQELTPDLRGGEVSGYRFSVELASDRSTYRVTAVPSRYGRTGMLSFYADPKGIHAENAGGAAIGSDAPVVTLDTLPERAQ